MNAPGELKKMINIYINLDKRTKLARLLRDEIMKLAGVKGLTHNQVIAQINRPHHTTLV